VRPTNFTNTPKRRYSVVLCSKQATEDLYRYSTSFKTFEWVVPHQIKHASSVIQAAFIKGFADSDGSARLRKGHSEVSLHSSNYPGLMEIRKMLHTTFGIETGVSKHKWGVYNIVITRYSYLLTFHNQIGFVIKRKMSNLSKGLKSYKRKGLRKYNIEFKKKALQMLKEGKSHHEVGRILNTSHTNIYDWEKARCLGKI
jgi:intein-encoded DNA endonuclease-like protein